MTVKIAEGHDICPYFLAREMALLEQRFGAGYEYTYLIPGLQKVVQAGGRVIPTPEDRGVIWLIDDRFPGFVSSREAIDTAVRVARGVKGVKSVTRLEPHHAVSDLQRASSRSDVCQRQQHLNLRSLILSKWT
jgi:hypothetical protein|tara:strand:+ start:23 stop:421 length:399 start_codon:yes stop_codon:yes gene_type:complete